MNTQIWEERTHFSLLIFRVSLGVMMLTHGWPKFQRLMAGNMKFADPLGLGSEISLILAVFAEFLCSMTLIIGLFTRLSASMLAFTMLVAALIQHGDDPFSKKEKALLYLAGYVILILMGSGKYSVDDRLNG
jgi:putative oxidoreductase